MRVSKGIKLAAIYLYEHEGKSTRYIAKKFKVGQSTVSEWIQNKDKIKAENTEGLSLRLFEFVLLREKIDWFGDDEDGDL